MRYLRIGVIPNVRFTPFELLKYKTDYATMLVDMAEKPGSKTSILQILAIHRSLNTQRMPDVYYADKSSYLSIDEDLTAGGIPTNVRNVPGVTPRKIRQ
ncbi:hypothetical protein AKAW_11311 [Aspergillus luchuensis IFO 4308]|nr:hypothetical protein AKAW_11311 [Aspergillus luchuensis IFO 4308]